MATTFDATAPDKLRTAIINKLGIAPGKLLGFGGNPAFDTNITNLYRDTTARLAALDTGQARLGSDYNTNLANLNYSNDQSKRAIIAALANRGLATSGELINQNAQLGRNYTNSVNQINQARTRGLEDIGRQRNDIINSLLSGRGTYESQYTQNLQDFLQGQAQAQAQLDATNNAAAQSQAAAKQSAATQAAITRKLSAPVVKPVSSVTPAVPTVRVPRATTGVSRYKAI